MNLKSNLAHGLTALVLMVPFLFFGGVEYVGLFLVAFFFGREVRDSEIANKIDPFKDPLGGLDVTKWTSGSVWDFFPVLFVYLALLILDDLGVVAHV